MNYIGVVIACLSGVVFLAIQTGQPEELVVESDEEQPILQPVAPAPRKLYLRTVGCVVAIFAGILFGLIFIPSTYIQDHPEGIYESASKNGLHYVYAMYSGIFFASMFYYIVYLVYKGNRPYLHVQSILPGIISGIMWGIAQAGFLVANSVLSQTISFPLVTIGPGTIAILWSIFYFREISGRRNYAIIIGGTMLRILAAVFIVLSKPIPR